MPRFNTISVVCNRNHTHLVVIMHMCSRVHVFEDGRWTDIIIPQWALVYEGTVLVRMRVHVCMAEHALHCEITSSSTYDQPNHSSADSMFRLRYPTNLKGILCDILCLWPHSFHKIMYFHSIYLVSICILSLRAICALPHQGNTLQ